MANIYKDGYIKTQDANGNIVTVYPYTKAGNVDGLDVFGASGSNHSTGLVPDPGATAGSTKYLREDGTWAEPAGGGGGAVDTVYIGSTEYAPDANGKVTLPNYPSVSGKIDTAGTGLSKSGTTLNHSNSVTAKTTVGAYKIKHDAQGHITGTSSLSYSDVGAASSSHTHSSYESLIDYGLSNGVRNVLDLNDVYFKHTTITCTTDAANGKIECSGTGPYQRVMYNVKLKSGVRYKLSWSVTSISTTYKVSVFPTTKTNAQTALESQVNCTSTGNYSLEFTATSDPIYICFYLNMDGTNRSVSFTATNIMLAEKSFFPSSFYQGAKSNAELTEIVDDLLSRVKALEGN